MEANARFLDQALFGYSDGHRQLASSAKLSSRDMYDLAAASDLAAGVTLKGDESYITGLPLKESKFYALVRTWAAPEMPRPGCVWSHVLLLEPSILGAEIDMGALEEYFHRPQLGEEKRFQNKIQIFLSNLGTAGSRPKADIDLVKKVVGQYYRGRSTVVGSGSDPAKIENAVFAIWSQQWPQLRATFRFRTAVSTGRLRSDDIKFDVIVSRDEESLDEDHIQEASREWIALGARDAILSEFTHLRKFLWRYGVDVESPRKRYQTLVKFEYGAELLTGDEMPAVLAATIFKAFQSPPDGLTLKREILGLDLIQPQLFPPLSRTNLLRQISMSNFNGLLSDASLEERLLSTPSEELTDLAVAYAEVHSSIPEYASVVEGVLSKIITKAALNDSRVPSWLRIKLLLSRPDLIDRHTIGVNLDDAFPIFESLPEGQLDADLLFHFMMHGPGHAGANLLATYPNETFLAAVRADVVRSLNRGWCSLIEKVGADVFAVFDFDRLRSTSEMAVALRLLGYPVGPTSLARAQALIDSIRKSADDVAGDAKMEFSSYLTVVGLLLRNDLSSSFLALGFNEVRDAIRRNAISSGVRSLLQGNLPSIGYSNWNLERRLLVALRGLRGNGDFTNLTRVLNLSASDMDVINETEVSTIEYPIWNPFRPWRW